jgi:hypothetical protein
MAIISLIIEEVMFTPDSLVVEGGFELSVPDDRSARLSIRSGFVRFRLSGDFGCADMRGKKCRQPRRIAAPEHVAAVQIAAL